MVLTPEMTMEDCVVAFLVADLELSCAPMA